MFQLGAVVEISCTVDSLENDVLHFMDFKSSPHGDILCSVDTSGILCSSNGYTVTEVDYNVYNLAIYSARFSDGGIYQCSFMHSASQATIMITVFG